MNTIRNCSKLSATENFETTTLTEALALTGRSVDVNLGADDVAERQEHLRQFHVTELLWQVIDEQIASLWTCAAASAAAATSQHKTY